MATGRRSNDEVEITLEMIEAGVDALVKLAPGDWPLMGLDERVLLILESCHPNAKVSVALERMVS